jgi:Tfp pilus assembly protein PilX
VSDTWGERIASLPDADQAAIAAFREAVLEVDDAEAALADAEVDLVELGARLKRATTAMSGEGFAVLAAWWRALEAEMSTRSEAR